jgi:hypothetical protein
MKRADSKFEARNWKFETNPNLPNPKGFLNGFEPLDFEFVSDFDIRISSNTTLEFHPCRVRNPISSILQVSPVQRSLRDADLRGSHVLVALVAARFWVVAKDAFPLGEVSPVEGLPVADPPALGRSVVFWIGCPPGHGHGKGPLPFQLRLLDLLAGQKDKESNWDAEFRR